MRYEIKGGSLPYLVCYLNNGQKIICEGGSMSWMTTNMQMESGTNGGVGKAIGRMFAGEGLFQNVYTATSDNAMITFSSSFPGNIIPVQVTPEKSVICQKTAFMAGTEQLNLSIHFRKKIGVGLFGGEGFIMQKISGNGIAFIEVDGSVQEYNLNANDKLIVSTGHLVMMDETCQMDVQTVKGLKNVFLGGEGLFNTVITGPGKVLLQSMPISKMANTLASYLPYNTNSSNNNSSGNTAVDAVTGIAKFLGK